MLLFLFSIAHAEESIVPKISVTLNPRQILNTFGETSIEYALKPKIGVGGITGFGKSDSAFQYDLGVQARYYLLGSFNGGLSAGGQFVYFNLLHRKDHDNINGYFLYPSLFLSGKYVFDIGFTIDSQLGVTYTTAIIKDQMAQSSITSTQWEGLFNVNLGWSF